MGEAQPPSYTELVHRVLRSAEEPMRFQEILAAVERRRPITSASPKSTIRSALNQSGLVVNTGNGRYWYLPHCIRGSLIRLPLGEHDPASEPLRLDHESLTALWPTRFEIAMRRSARPAHLRLPSGEDAPLESGGDQFGWFATVSAPLHRYLVDQHPVAGDALLIRVLDAESGLCDAWLETRAQHAGEAVASRNKQVADAAFELLRRRTIDRVPIWDVAVGLLARGAYRADVAADPLGKVLQSDRRFQLDGLSGFPGAGAGSTSVFVSARYVPDPAIPKPPIGTLYQVKVTLRGTHPPVWRRLVLDADTPLATLHRILQAAMGWSGYHLHQFESGKRVIGDPSRDEWRDLVDERGVALYEVAPTAKSRLRYEYDFGDAWQHDVIVEKVLPPLSHSNVPACLDGSRACPPEDVGGVWGYETFLAAIQDPSHPQHEDLREWVGVKFDPDAFDIENVNARLRRFR